MGIQDIVAVFGLRRLLGIASVIACMCSMTGCGLLTTVSLHPLSTESNVVADERLVGDWREESDSVFSISRKGTSSDKWTPQVGYVVRERGEDDDGNEVEWSAPFRVVQLDDLRFWEFTVKSRDDFIPFRVHVFVRGWVENDTLRRAWPSDDWLSEQLTEHGLDLAHERILYDGEEQIVLTASTPDLQAFCLAYAQDPDAFVESGRPAHRLSGGDAAPTTD